MSFYYRYYLVEPKDIIIDKAVSKYVGYTKYIEEYELRLVKQYIKKNLDSSKFIGTNLYRYLDYLEDGIDDCVIIDLGVFEFTNMYDVIDKLDQLRVKHNAKLNLKFPDKSEDVCCHNNFKLTCRKCRLECWHYKNKYNCPKCKTMPLPELLK